MLAALERLLLTPRVYPDIWPLSFLGCRPVFASWLERVWGQPTVAVPFCLGALTGAGRKECWRRDRWRRVWPPAGAQSEKGPRIPAGCCGPRSVSTSVWGEHISERRILSCGRSLRTRRRLRRERGKRVNCELRGPRMCVVFIENELRRSYWHVPRDRSPAIAGVFHSLKTATTVAMWGTATFPPHR